MGNIRLSSLKMYLNSLRPFANPHLLIATPKIFPFIVFWLPGLVWCLRHLAASLHDLGHWLCLAHTHIHPPTLSPSQFMVKRAHEPVESPWEGKTRHTYINCTPNVGKEFSPPWRVVPPISSPIGRTQNFRALIGRGQNCSFYPSLRLASELSRKRTF